MPPRWLRRGRRSDKKSPTASTVDNHPDSTSPATPAKDEEEKVPLATSLAAARTIDSRASIPERLLPLDKKGISRVDSEDEPIEEFAAPARERLKASSSADDLVPDRPKPSVQSVAAGSSLDSKLSSKMEAYPNTDNSSLTMIPIAPNVNARLRGANETWTAIEQDFYVPVVCFACSLEICCIQDADYVICPACRVVSPLEESQMSSAHPKISEGGAKDLTVGLGFTFEDLLQWQSEILRSGGSDRALHN